MIVGSENMEKKQIKDLNGRKKNVLDYKEGVEPVFPIGHLSAESETFHPIFYKFGQKSSIEDDDLHFVDIAGLKDTGGQIFDMINSLTNRKVFNHSSKVRFLFFIEENSVEGGRGKIF